MEHLNVVDILFTLITFANLWVNKSIKEKILELKLDINQNFVSKQDFSDWSSHHDRTK